MQSPDSLQIALKEWASVCDALEVGRQMILLRKGGIYEAAGEFELENPQFLLFPTYLHQSRAQLKPEAHASLRQLGAEPGEVKLRAAAVVTDIVQLSSRRQMDAIDDEHIWTASLIDMRFNYKPQNPLYLLLVRTFRLAQQQVIANTAQYAGCKSWVPLDRPIDTTASKVVLDDGQYQARRDRIIAAIQSERQV